MLILLKQDDFPEKKRKKIVGFLYNNNNNNHLFRIGPRLKFLTREDKSCVLNYLHFWKLFPV